MLVSQPFYLFIDIYGNSTSVELVDPTCVKFKGRLKNSQPAPSTTTPRTPSDELMRVDSPLGGHTPQLKTYRRTFSTGSPYSPFCSTRPHPCLFPHLARSAYQSNQRRQTIGLSIADRVRQRLRVHGRADRLGEHVRCADCEHTAKLYGRVGVRRYRLRSVQSS